MHLLAKPTHAQKHDPLPHVLKHLQGAFSLLFLFPGPDRGVPRSVGRAAAGAWEDSRGALVRGERDVPRSTRSGRRSMREVEPGEIVRIDESGLQSRTV